MLHIYIYIYIYDISHLRVKAREGGNLDTACLLVYSDLKRNLTSAGEKLPVNRVVFLLLFRKVSVSNRDLCTD